MAIDDGAFLPPGGVDPGSGVADRKVRRLVAVWVALLVLVAVAVVALAAWWFRTAPTRAARASLGEQGGVVLVVAPVAPRGGEVTEEQVRLVTLLLRHRIDDLGVARSEVVTRGSGASTTITVSLGGLHDEQAARALAGPVSFDFREVMAEALASSGKTGTPTSPPVEAAADGPELRAQYAAAACPTAGRSRRPVGQDPSAWLVACSQDGALKYLLGPAAITGDMVASVTTVERASGYEVDLLFDARGAAALADVSARLAARSAPRNQLAFVLDSEVVSAPWFSQAVVGGSAIIYGSFTSAEAAALAASISAGTVPQPATVLSVEVVPPQ